MNRREFVVMLRACLRWVEDNGGELVFKAGGVVELVDGDEELAARLEDFDLGKADEQLRELLDEAEHEPAPAPAGPPIANNVTWFGIGQNRFAWEERRTLILSPDRDLQPQRFVVPSSTFGYLLRQIRSGGVELLTAAGGVPVELFSEISHAPQLLWPSVGPKAPLELDIQAPAAPKAPAPFTGALYGLTRGKP